MERIVHIIVGLGSGGAENMLLKTLRYSNKSRYYHEVISLTDRGTVGKDIEKIGIKVHSLNLTSKNFLSSVLKIKKICVDFDIINTWMYHADFIGFIVGKIFLNKKLIWNVRHSNLDLNANKVRTLFIAKINSFFSSKVNLITYNSDKAYETHKSFGYQNNKIVVIPNGFETNKFLFNIEDRKNMRNALNINEDELVLITVGRWHIQKGYVTLLKAIRELKKSNLKFKLIMVGKDLDNENLELLNLITEYDVNSYVLLVGVRNDIPTLLSASDIYISSSLGESFSNSLGEAMSCGLPCIATNVGDSKKIVGNAGYTVEVNDYREIAKKIYKIYVNSEGKKLSIVARDRVVKHYDIKNVIFLYEKNYVGLE